LDASGISGLVIDNLSVTWLSPAASTPPFGVISNESMKLAAITTLLFSLPHSLASQECKCRAPEPGATTRKGYFESVVIQSNTRYRRLIGIVSLADHPVDDVFVELFPYSKDASVTRTRLAACVTDLDGRYCFANVPKGRYEVRVSKDGGFEITHVNVYVDPKNPKASNAELGITLELGK
jgi:hypothetical protein